MPDPQQGFLPDEPLSQPLLPEAAPAPDFLPDESQPDPLAQTLSNARQQTTPETAARVLRLRGITGLPPAVIERDIDNIERRALAKDFDAEKFRKESPVLAQWLAQPENAAVAHDDIEPLSLIEQAFRVAGNSARATLTGIPKANAYLWGVLEEGSALVGSDPWTKYFKALRLQADAIGEKVKGPQAGAGDLEKSFYAGWESLGAMAPGLAMSVVTKSPTPMLSLMGAQTFGQASTEALDAGKTPEEAAWYGAHQTAFEVLTERIPAGWLVGDIAKNTPFLKTLWKQAVGEGLGEQVATATQDLTTWIHLHPERTLQDYLNERPSAMAQTLVATLVMVGATTTVAKALDRATGTSESQRMAQDIAKAVQGAQLNERSREKLVEFAAQASKDNGVENVSVPVAQFVEYFQSKGANPAKVAELLTGRDDALTFAQEMGELVIPTPNYIAQVIGSGHESFFEKEVRWSPQQLNARETTERLAVEDAKAAEEKGAPVAEGEDVLADENVKPPSNDADAIHQGLVAELVATGRASRGDADVMARVMADAFPNIAQRTGIPVVDQWLPTVTDKAEDEPLPVQQFNQGIADQLTLEEERLRGLTPDTSLRPGDSRGVPFPVVDNPTSLRLYEAADRTQMRTARVPVSSLVATQPTIDADIVREKMRGFDRSNRTDEARRPLALEYGGRYYLADGTHLATAGWARAEENIDVDVMPVMADRLFSPPTTAQSFLATPRAQEQAYAGLKRRLEETGGFTLNAAVGGSPTTGFAVSAYPERGRVLPVEQLTLDSLATYLVDNGDLLLDPTSDAHLGAWVDGGQVYLDVTIVAPTPEAAERVAVQFNELAYYNLQAGETIRVTDEARARVASEAADLGRAGGDVRAADGAPADGRGPGARPGDAAASPGTGEPGTGVSAPAPTRPSPSRVVQGVASAYMRAHGIPGAHFTASYLPVDEALGKRVAEAYAALPVDDSANQDVLAAYTAFVDEVQNQWDFAVQSGMRFEPWTGEGQPYATSVEMAEDVAQGHLYFYVGGELHHPLMSAPDANGLTPNDKFRAIHDYYAHAGGGFGFGPRGEENAWRAHMQLFSPAAQRAMTTETRGQNSWVNFGPQNYTPQGEPLNIDPAARPYATQKLALLPGEFSTLGDQTYYQRAKEAVPQGHDLNPVEFKDNALLVGTRYIDKGTKNTPFQTALLTTGFDLFRSSPEPTRKGQVSKMAQAAALFRSFTLIPEAAKAAATSDEALVRAGIDAMKDNLRALWHSYPAEWRERATHWYIGANRIANELGETYGVTTEQAAGVLACLSPQMDWFRNVSLAERVLSLAQSLAANDEAFTSEMAEQFRATQTIAVETWIRQKMKSATPEAVEAYRQMKAQELSDVYQLVGTRWSAMDVPERARLLRNYDELNNPRSYDIISPEGDRPGPVKNQPKVRVVAREPKTLKPGETVAPTEDGRFAVTTEPDNAQVAWGAYVFIENALTIVADGSTETISASLGGEHKVRSFFNNISHPWDARSVTIDTHAVAAAFLQPLSGASVEVIATMNGSKPKGHAATFPQEASTGMSGINGIVAQAYFELGQELGVLPRAVQSATWEAVRSLYKPEQKRSTQGQALAAQVQGALESYGRGEQSHAQAFTTIAAAAGGFEPPAWADVPVSEQGALAVASVQPRRAGVSAGRGATGGYTGGLAGRGADDARRDGVVLGAVGSASTFHQRTRGAITFRRGLPPVLRMFKASNRSTFFHETGHLFLEMMGSLTEQLEAQAAAGQPLDVLQQQFVDDYRQVVLPWLGVATRAEIGTPQHEQFARGFESHLMSGAVPGTGLNAVFARVTRWLRSLYRGLEGLSREAGFEVPPLPADIAAVMNRLLLSDQAIADAQSQQEVRPLFTTAESAQVDPVEFAGYREKVQRAGETARERLTQKLMSDIVREEADAWKEELRTVTAEVTAAVNAEPVYTAMEAMRRGKPPLKLSKTALVGQFGEGILRQLPRPYLYQVEGGQSPEVVADAFGFPSAQAMLDAIIAAKPKDAEIETRVAATMEERHGSVANDPEAVKLEALAAVLNEHQDEVVRAELQMLRKLQRDAKPSVRAATSATAQAGKTGAAALKAVVLNPETTAAWARARVGAMKLQDISPARYLAVAVRASQRAQEAAAVNDFETAITEKQSQLANLMLYHEATRLRDEIQEVKRTYDEMFTADDKVAPRRDMAYVLAARSLAGHYFWPERVRNETAREKFDQLKAYEPDVHASLEPQVSQVLALAPTLAKMTADQFHQFREAVDGLWALSRSTRTQFIDGEALDRESMVNRLTDRMHELPSKPPRTETVTTFLSWRAAATRVEHWVSMMDGGPQGPFRALLFNPVREAITRYRTAKVTTLTAYLDLLKTIQPTLVPGRIEAPELGYTFASRAALLHAVLHSGNESNLTKLVIGYNWGALDEAANLDRSRWDAFMARATADGTLTKADMDFVQGVWDLNEGLKTGAQLAHRELYGRYFNEVTAHPVRTPFGVYRGGYVPAILDPFQSADGVAKANVDALEGVHGSMFPQPGFTKDRSATYAQPLALDLTILPQHMDKVLRFTHIMPQAKATQRLVKDRSFRETMHGIDPTAVSELLLPWLERGYNQRVTEPSSSLAGRGADRVFRALRTRTGLNMMAGHVINTLQQLTGLSQAMLLVKPRYLRNALWRFMREPKKLAQAISDADPFMNTRLQASAFEIQGHIDDLLLPSSKWERLDTFGQKHGYLLQSVMQNTVDNIVWQGAYDQAVEGGAGHDSAVRSAGAAVRQSQGSFSPEDISRVEVQATWLRLFTMFYGYFNNMANLNAGQLQTVARDLGLKQGAGRGLYIYTFGFMMPAVLAEVILRSLGGGPDEDDDDSWLDAVMGVFFGSQVRAATGMLPYVGQALQASINIYMTDAPYDDRISTSPAISSIESVARAPHSVYVAITEGRDGSARRAVRDSLTAIGMLTGAPVGALMRPLGYAAEVFSGGETPEGPVDAVQGLVSGR